MLVVTGILGVFTVDKAMAQTRPAYTKNVDEPGRIPYQYAVDFQSGTSACVTNSFCIVPFPAVPAGKRLVVEHLTVFAAVSGGGIPNLLAFGDNFVTNQNNVFIIPPTFTPSVTSLGATFYALERPVRVYYEPGTTPKVKIGASANFAFTCNMTLHGYLIDASN
jgi:hypothetical protein